MMKKYILLLSFFLIGKMIFAQTSTLVNLVDSLPGGGFAIIESYKQKLYTYPSHTGGPLAEIDQNTGALTPLFTIPVLTSPWEYTTYSGNFIFLNGKTVLSLHNPAGPGDYVIAAGPLGADTLLSHITPFGTITAVDTMAYLLFSDSAGVGAKLYATNLNSPALLIDSDITVRTKATDYELFYIKSHYPAVYDQQLFRTNGMSKTLVEQTTGSSNQIALMGMLNGDMYYTVCKRAMGMDTTWIKKCNTMGVVSVIDTIMMNAASLDHGLMGLGTKLIIPFKHETTPFYQDLIVYDLSNNTKVNVSQNNYSIRTYDLEQTQVASDHFYFNTINPLQRYISDATILGTKVYGTQASGYGNDLKFENYATYHTLGNKAALCNEYPSAAINDEFYYGSDTGLVLFKLFPVTKSYPSHFNKIGNNTFFRIHDGAYTKMTLLKMTDCGMPINNPLGLADVKKMEYSLSPNPSSDGRFTIQFANDMSQVQCSVVNAYGQVVNAHYEQINPNTIRLQLQPSAKGIYFLNMKSKSVSQSAKLILY
jgi:hypothetical protein